MRTVSKWVRNGATAVAIVGIALSFHAPAVAQTTPAAPEPQPTQPVPLILPGDPPDLVMFFTGDVIGYLTPCG
jgi:hypothetical protein